MLAASPPRLSALALLLALGPSACVMQPVLLVTAMREAPVALVAQVPGLSPPVVELPATPPRLDFNWAQNLVAYRGHPGMQLLVRCPAGGTPGTVWGTDLYSDDSSVCTAAAHSGRVSFAQGGEVRVLVLAGAGVYTGSARGGVSSASYGAWPGSFVLLEGPAPGLTATPTPPAAPAPAPAVQFQPGVPTEVSWSTNATSVRGRVGQRFVAVCPPGGAAGTVWGTEAYTDDSSVCTAAVHAGRLTLAQGGVVTFWAHPGRGRYAGSSALGVSTQPWERAWAGSFAFSPEVGPEPPPPVGPRGSVAIAWEDTAERWRNTQRDVLLFCPPNGSAGNVWGTALYSDDSSVCTAAVHAGRLTFEQGGLVRLRPAAGRSHYAGTLQHGVESSAWEDFPGSFVLLPASLPARPTREEGLASGV